MQVDKQVPPDPLSSEDQLSFEILALLTRVPLWQRESILATVASFVASEQEAYEDELKRKLMAKLTGMGCCLQEVSR